MAAPTRTGGKPSLAVWKLASCDGCQLTLLDCEDELLAVAGAVEIAHFTEASSAVVEGPYDVSLVEGSVTTERDARRIIQIRAASRMLVCVGACATSGGPFYDGYNVVNGVDKIVPVDVYIPGCPPRPEALFQGLLELQKKIQAMRIVPPVPDADDQLEKVEG